MLSSNLNPLIERYVKDSVSKSFVPAYSQQSAAMHQELLHELRTEIHAVKKESIAWQNEATRGQEVWSFGYIYIHCLLTSTNRHSSVSWNILFVFYRTK